MFGSKVQNEFSHIVKRHVINVPTFSASIGNWSNLWVNDIHAKTDALNHMYGLWSLDY